MGVKIKAITCTKLPGSNSKPPITSLIHPCDGLSADHPGRQSENSEIDFNFQE
jgi:hypothetical protein